MEAGQTTVRPGQSRIRAEEIDFCVRKIMRAELHVQSVLDELKQDGSEEAAAPF
jgi:hypothetical protein